MKRSTVLIVIVFACAVASAAQDSPAEIVRRSLDAVGPEREKNADLVLLNANPLDNISNTGRRAGVMLKGKYYTQAELDRWLDQIAPRLAGSLEKK